MGRASQCRRLWALLSVCWDGGSTGLRTPSSSITATTLPIADRWRTGAFRGAARGPTTGGRNGAMAEIAPAGLMRADTTALTGAEASAGQPAGRSRDSVVMRGPRKASIAAIHRGRISTAGRRFRQVAIAGSRSQTEERNRLQDKDTARGMGQIRMGAEARTEREKACLAADRGRLTVLHRGPMARRGLTINVVALGGGGLTGHKVITVSHSIQAGSTCLGAVTSRMVSAVAALSAADIQRGAAPAGSRRPKPAILAEGADTSAGVDTRAAAGTGAATAAVTITESSC